MVTTHYNFYVARTCPLILILEGCLPAKTAYGKHRRYPGITAHCSAPIIAPVVSRHASHCMHTAHRHVTRVQIVVTVVWS